MICAGELNKRITLQSKTSAADTCGEMIETWATLCIVWAAIKPLSGKELQAAQQLHAESRYKFTIRYRSGITTVNRVLYGSRVFDILFVQNPEEANTELVLYCKELV